MAFFKTLSDAAQMVQGFVKNFTLPGASPYEVQEISSGNIGNLTKCTLLCRDDCVTLYKEGTVFFAVLHYPANASKAYSLFRVSSEVEATTTFSNLSFKLQPLYQSCARIVCTEMLQKFVDLLRAHPTWSCAHLAAGLGLKESFRHALVKHHLDAIDETTQMLPVMVAIDTGSMECIQELIISGVKLDLADGLGNNVFHYAAKCQDPTPIQYLGSRDKTSLNQLNLSGESALHAACLAGIAKNVEHLLRWGADPLLTMSGRYPIHCAMKADSVKCVETLCYWSRDQIHLQDTKYGGMPIHWAKSKECIYTLADLGCNLDAPNTAGEPALHVMVARHRRNCVMALLSKGANAAATVTTHGNNALHLAIEADDADLVKTLIVFGSDVNYLNSHKLTPRHVAATSPGKNSQKILYLLHKVGAMRCKEQSTSCPGGCVTDGTNNGEMCSKTAHTPEHQKKFLESMVSDVAMAAAMTRSASATGSAIMSGEVPTCPTRAGDRVLSLDGGGIRGLVLIQLLLAIEKAAGQPVRTLFDWIAGTSTGGILALGIVHGKSVRYCQGLYFRLKDEVFQGSRPYSSEPLEKMMKKEFGETIRMTEKEYPRVLVTGVLGDRNPCELHFFRNYDPPGRDHQQIYKTEGQFEPPPRPNEQFVWQAARSSGAAPTYFRAFGRFLDGGLMANNPTLDLLTEIHEYNMGLNSVGSGNVVRPVHVVVSLGTGRMPVVPVTHSDIYRPEGLIDFYKVATGAKNLAMIMVETVTQSEGRPVDRARAWCNMIHVPMFRLSPQLSEDIPLDCTDDGVLINMLWETQCYIHDHWDRIEQLATLLK